MNFRVNVKTDTVSQFSSNWNNGSKCGSRSSNWNNGPLNLNSNNSSQAVSVSWIRGVFEPNSTAEHLSLLVNPAEHTTEVEAG
ncbi:MAG: hypothetical protein ACOC5T_08775 [Elusimicrobiota bacterium]